MIAIIRVTLTHGELNGQDQLQGIAANLYPNEALPEQYRHAYGIQRYIVDLPSVYICIPRNASRASFVWGDAQEFEIVVETVYQGNLMHSAEGIVRRLTQRLDQLGMKTKIVVYLQSTGDAREYMVGETGTVLGYLWDKMRDNVIAILVALLGVIMAKVWFQDFYQEAVVSLVTLILLSLWQAYRAWQMGRNRSVYWRIHDQAG